MSLHEVTFGQDEQIAHVDNLNEALQAVIQYALSGQKPQSVREAYNRLYVDRRMLLTSDPFTAVLLSHLPFLLEDTPFSTQEYPFTRRTLTALTPDSVLERVSDYKLDKRVLGLVVEHPVLIKFYDKMEINDANLKIGDKGILWTDGNKKQTELIARI